MQDAGFAVPMARSLATRLCHDLAGPLVGVMAALDMAMPAPPGGAGDDEPLLVASESARHLSARLGLLRAAWGDIPGPMDAPSIAALADGLPNRARLELDIGGLGAEPVTGAVGQILVNMLLLAAASLPKGGVIAMARDGDELAVRIAGTMAAWPAGLNAMLLSPEDAEPTPRSALPILLGLLARQAGMRVCLPVADGMAGGIAGAGASQPLLLSPA